MTTPHPIRKPHQEHSVPWFWPLAAAIELGEEGLHLYQRNVAFLTQAHVINAPPALEWATPNRIDVELNTMRIVVGTTLGSISPPNPSVNGVIRPACGPLVSMRTSD